MTGGGHCGATMPLECREISQANTDAMSANTLYLLRTPPAFEPAGFVVLRPLSDTLDSHDDRVRAARGDIFVQRNLQIGSSADR